MSCFPIHDHDDAVGSVSHYRASFVITKFAPLVDFTGICCLLNGQKFFWAKEKTANSSGMGNPLAEQA